MQLAFSVCVYTCLLNATIVAFSKHAYNPYACLAGVIVREGAARDRELRVLAAGQSDVDRSFMESEFAKARSQPYANSFSPACTVSLTPHATDMYADQHRRLVNRSATQHTHTSDSSTCGTCRTFS